MKDNIHPDYMECSVTCLCGSGHSWKTRATVPEEAPGLKSGAEKCDCLPSQT